MNYLLEVGQPDVNITFPIEEPSIKDAALACAKLSESELSEITSVKIMQKDSTIVKEEVVDLVEFKEKVLRSKRIIESIDNNSNTIYKFIGIGNNTKNSALIEIAADQVDKYQNIVVTLFDMIADLNTITVYKNDVITSIFYRKDISERKV